MLKALWEADGGVNMTPVVQSLVLQAAMLVLRPVTCRLFLRVTDSLHGAARRGPHRALAVTPDQRDDGARGMPGHEGSVARDWESQGTLLQEARGGRDSRWAGRLNGKQAGRLAG